ncbi:MAG: hypothetical protein AAFV25_03690, partial [Bacteroidota bacterium]
MNIENSIGIFRRSRRLSHWIICLLICLFSVHCGLAQTTIEWDRTFGGDQFEELTKAIQTSDGGYLLGGSSSSGMSGDVSQASRGGADYWVVRTDANGNKLWDARYGGNNGEILQYVEETSDGGFILGGWSSSDAVGDKTEANNGPFWTTDFWIVKIDANGNQQWDKSFGGDQNEQLWEVHQTADGGYIMGGWSTSGINGDKTEASRGGFDYWLVKTDASGNKVWDKTYGGIGTDMLLTLQPTTDGGYILGGLSGSGVSTDKSQPVVGSLDFWLVKTNATGVIQWDRTYGGLGNDQLRSLQQTSDGGYILGGFSDSDNNGDKTGVNRGSLDFWIIKTNASGFKEWDSTFGGSAAEDLNSIYQTDKGIYIAAGYSQSPLGGDKTAPLKGSLDYWTVYIDANGNQLYDQGFGGSGNNVCYDFIRTNDNGYLLAGHSDSNASGDKTQNNNGANDQWIVKLSCDPQIDLPQDTSICAGTPLQLNLSIFSRMPCAYLWEDGSTMASRSLSPLDTSMYKVTVTDIHGCTSTDSIQVNIIPSPSLDLGMDTSICDGQSLVLDAGIASSYDWSTGATSQSISVSTPGSYAVTITDANGCQVSDTLQVLVHGIPTISLGSDRGFCLGDSLLLDAGTASSYEWSTGDNSQSIFVNASGNYAVTITDINGCQNSDDINITVNNLPIVELGNDTVLCQGNAITLDAGLASSYDWSTGDNSQTISVNASGNYSVTITDANGCQNSDDINITVNNLPIVELGNDTVLCQGNSIMLDAGVASNYDWSTGDNSQTIAVNASGNYTVTITDANGCQNSDDINITVNDLPVVELGNDTAFCQGNSITLDAGLASSYDWSTGGNSQTIAVNASGNYAVTITDANGCQNSDDINITVNDLPVVELGNDTAFCQGNSITLDAGLASSYDWS